MGGALMSADIIQFTRCPTNDYGHTDFPTMTFRSVVHDPVKLLVWDKIFGTTGPLAGFAAVTRSLVVRSISPREVSKPSRGSSSDEQLGCFDVRALVVETVAEQQRLHRDDVDVVVLRSVVTGNRRGG
jgi:hypothetical protein